MNRVKKLIHTDYAYKSGLSGRNVTVAVMDTGECVMGMHKAFVFHCFPALPYIKGIGQSIAGIR